MPKSITDPKPWKRNLAGVSELAHWAGVEPPAIAMAIKREKDFPEPEDFLGMGTVYRFKTAVEALEKMGFTEGGGKRDGSRPTASE